MDINIDDALDSNPHHANVVYFIISPYDALPTPPSSTACQASANASERNDFLK